MLLRVRLLSLLGFSFLRQPEQRGAGRRRPGGHTGGLRSSWAATTVLPVGWLCYSGVGAEGQKGPEQLDIITITAATYSEISAYFKYSKVEILVFVFFYLVSIFGAKRSLLRYFQQFLHFLEITWQSAVIVWVVLCELHPANERWVKRTRV